MKANYILKRLFRYVSRYKLRLIVLILIGLSAVVFELAKPLPIKVVIDNILSGHPLPHFILRFFGSPTFLTDRKQLLFLCVALIVTIAVSSALLSMLVMNLTIKLSQRLVYDLSIDFYSKFQQLSLSFYSRHKVGDLLQRMSGDVFIVYFLVAQIIVPVITSMIFLVVMFYVMVQIDWVLALIALAIIPFLCITLAIFMKPMKDTGLAQNKKLGQLSAFVQQSLSSMKIIQAFARESFMQNKVQTHAFDYGKAFESATKVSYSFNQVTVLISSIATAALIGLGAYRGMNGSFTGGDLYIFIGYIGGLYGPVTSLFTAAGASAVIASKGKRVFEVLDSTEVIKEHKHAKPVIHPKGVVVFENVSFGYHENQTTENATLKNISFEARAGEIIAIVGPTGAGKTSLISLITRFFDPWQGQITLDGTDIRHIQLHSLRETISLVLQEPFLFPMSIADNIVFGNPAASMEEIVEAAKLAQAHDFIMKQPDGYNTLISEGVTSLSGGERQRIAIARAFLKKSSILIMDEPTSAVDSLTESKIFKGLATFAKGKTIFLISHRLSTIKHANQILTINDGCIVERGTHESLLEEGNMYADLFKFHHIS